MTIAKSILITSLLIIVWIGSDILILLSNNAILITPKIGFYGIITQLLTCCLFVMYLRFSKEGFSIGETIIASKRHLILIIIILAIGLRLFDLPFWQWQQLSNKYLHTAFSNHKFLDIKFSYFQLYEGISGVIFAPFFEEIIFRYYIFGGLLKKYSFLTALLTSSLLFSLIHIDSPRNLIPTFILGLISAIVYFRTKKIRYSILLHFIGNALWFITVVFGNEYQRLIMKIGLGGLFWILFLIGIVLVILGLKTITTAYNHFGKIRAKPAILQR